MRSRKWEKASRKVASQGNTVALTKGRCGGVLFVALGDHYGYVRLIIGQ